VSLISTKTSSTSGPAIEAASGTLKRVILFTDGRSVADLSLCEGAGAGGKFVTRRKAAGKDICRDFACDHKFKGGLRASITGDGAAFMLEYEKEI